MQKVQPLYLAGEWVTAEEKLAVISPYSGNVVGQTYWADPTQIEKAVQACGSAETAMRQTTIYERQNVLEQLATGIEKHRDEFVRLLALEAGKPVREGRIEVERALLTLRTTAAECQRMHGEAIPLDVVPGCQGRTGMLKRFPIGAMLAITPFNYPLNLALHKVAPAIAVGNPVLLKPSPKTPLISLLLAEIIATSDLPREAFSVLVTSNVQTRALAADERFKMLTFTGSAEVGWQLKTLAGRKRVALELGGNAGVVIDEDAGVERAVGRVKFGAFVFAGQSCISVQRVFVHERLFERFVERLVEVANQVKIGDPLDPTTELGPLINTEAVQRVTSWIKEACAGGAKILSGGEPLDAQTFPPTVVVDVPTHCRLYCEEVFAPVVLLYPFTDFHQALAEVNNSRYGLQAGIFTNNHEHIWYAYEHLAVGGVIINDVPTFRVDPMPYGGIKASGVGREGPRYAMEEMSELKLLVLDQIR